MDELLEPAALHSLSFISEIQGIKSNSPSVYGSGENSVFFVCLFVFSLLVCLDEPIASLVSVPLLLIRHLPWMLTLPIKNSSPLLTGRSVSPFQVSV